MGIGGRVHFFLPLPHRVDGFGFDPLELGGVGGLDLGALFALFVVELAGLVW